MTGTAFKKAMILAAGLGTRLHPITHKIPKPLVPVLNIPNIRHNLFLLKRLGVEEVILNTFHLPELIEKFLGDGRKWGITLHYSRETTLLGTGGGVKKAEAFFKKEPFILANCDFVTNFDLSYIALQHLKKKALATMVLFSDPSRQKFYSKVGTDSEGSLCSLPKFSRATPLREGIFTGIHFLDPAVLPFLKEEPSSINEVLYPTLMKEHPNRVYGEFVSQGYWYDTGDLPFLYETSTKLLASLLKGNPFLAALLQEQGYRERSPGIWVHDSFTLPVDITLLPPVVVGENCRFGKGVSLGPWLVLDADCDIEDGITVTHLIALKGSKISQKTMAPATSGAIAFENLVLSAARTYQA